MSVALIRRLGRERGAVTAIEFSVVAPVLIVGVLGMFDLAYNIYTDALLQGAVQKAARDSTIEGAASQSAALDTRVATMVHKIAPSATLDYQRKSYTNFADVNQPEDFTDLNKNGSCDDGEPFEDANGNKAWDRDRGSRGFGGARDAVLYTVTIDYPRMFSVAGMLGQSRNFQLVATTVLRNQPYNLQTSATKAGNCT